MIPPHSSLTFTGSSPLFGLVAGVGGGARDQPHGRVGAEPCQLDVHLNAVQKGRSVVPVFSLARTGATVRPLVRLPYGVLRLPPVVVVVEGDHVHGGLVISPGHAPHDPGVRGVVG